MSHLNRYAGLVCLALAAWPYLAPAQRPTLTLRPAFGQFHRECVGGPNDGLACTATADCEEDEQGIVFSECERFCAGGPNDGEPCVIGYDDCAGGGVCAQQCFCNYVGPPSIGRVFGDVLVSDWSRPLSSWQIWFDLEGLCDAAKPLGWDVVTDISCMSNVNCPAEAPSCHIDPGTGLPTVCVTDPDVEIGATMDVTRTDYIFFGISGTYPFVSLGPEFVQFLDAVPFGPFVEDTGDPKYLATVEFQVAPGACGTLDIPLLPPPLSILFDEFLAPLEPMDVVTITMELPACSCTQITTAAQPGSCAVDARENIQPDGTPQDGWSSVAMGLDCDDTTELTPCHFAVRTVPLIRASERPQAVSHNDPESGWVTLSFPPIPAGVWTCISYDDSQHCLGLLPGDSDGDGVAQAADVSHLGACLADPQFCASYQCDIDRSGLCGPADLLREVDVLQGAQQFEAWAGRTLPACPSLP